MNFSPESLVLTKLPNPRTGQATALLCAFCPQRRFELNGLADLPGESSIVYRGETIYVTPDIAPIRNGHLLAIPCEHHLSLAQAGVAYGQQLYAELEYIYEWYGRAFGAPPQLFEHGSVFEDDGGNARLCGSCIDHAHMHLLPAGTIDESRAAALLGIGIETSLEELRHDVSLQPYVYLGAGSRARIYRSTPSRQLLRWLAGDGRLDRDATWQVRYRQPASQRSFVATLQYAQACHH